MHQRERGIALITAMFIVALVATIAAYLSLNQTIWLRQSQNFADLAQAEAAATAGLNAAAVLLVMEAAKEPDTDYLGEEWAKPLPAFPLEGGAIAITVSDAQSRFNLNNLASQAGANTYGPVFRNLLRLLDLPDATDSLIDWLDGDDTVSANGAEDSTYYLSLPTPYRAANRQLESVDELRLIRGFTAEAVRKLRPFVTVLPKSTDVNINTAPPEVISAMFLISPDIQVVEQMISGREKTPFKNCTDLEKRANGLKIIKDKCAWKTGFFEVMIDARFGRLNRRTLALMQRDSKSAVVLWQRQYIVKDLRVADQD